MDGHKKNLIQLIYSQKRLAYLPTYLAQLEQDLAPSGQIQGC